MKTGLLTFFLLAISFFPQQITAQSLVQEGLQWNVGAVYWSFPPFSETISVKLEGDTLIGALLYKKVYESYDSLNLFWVETGEYIREDEDQKVYFRQDNEQEILLYDFNLMVGDTFPIYQGADQCNFMEVMQIDTITIFNGETRRRWTMESPELNSNYRVTFYWMEGIGSSLGLFRYMTENYCWWEHYPYSVLCHYVDDEMVYVSNQNGVCWLTTSVRELNEEEDGISVFPNPANEKIFIQAKQSDQQIAEVKLYAASGQLLKQVQLNTPTGTLNLNEYPSGAYYLLIEDSDGRLLSKRLIKF